MSGSDEGSSDEKAELSREWFGSCTSSLEQGDVLVDFQLPAITFDEGDGQLGLERRKQTVIIVTQSCDIQKKSQTELLLASVFDFEELKKSADAFRRTDFREAVSRGTAVSEFALPPRPGGNGEFLIVSFRKLHVVPKAYVLANMGSAELRLRSPYKEYFAQAYARFMMRVGLPLPMHSIT